VKPAAIERATRTPWFVSLPVDVFCERSKQLSTCFTSRGLMSSHLMPWNYVRFCSTSELQRLRVLLLLDLQSNQRSETCLTYISKCEQRIQHWKTKVVNTWMRPPFPCPQLSPLGSGNPAVRATNTYTSSTSMVHSSTLRGKLPAEDQKSP
jgi:hypothetical protein